MLISNNFHDKNKFQAAKKLADENHEIHFFKYAIGFKGSWFFFHAVVLAGTPPSTDFKSIYSNQFKRYEYIQDIWEMQNFMKNTMIKFAGRIFCLLGQNLMIF